MLNIKIDSRLVTDGDIFVAIKGENVDGHDFIEEAIKKGAKKIIAERGIYSVETQIVKDTQKYLTDYLINNKSNDLKDLKIIGVTGTNGKTTSCFIVYQMLLELGAKAAYIGTIGFFINGKLIRNLPNTTQVILETYNLLLEAKENGVEFVVMEVSSHALELGRLEGINFDIGAFTNLTQDHLDFHKSMDNYLSSKKKILDKLKPSGRMVLNADDEYCKHFQSNSYISVGKNGRDYKFEKIDLLLGSTGISFIAFDKKYHIETNFTGYYNVYNFMTALSIVVELGFNINDVLKTVVNVKPPKGRCQTISVNEFQVVIDYAHTPDAVEKIIEAFNLSIGRIITVIGCGGDRDPVKRPIMGNIATQKSDFVVFTNDNPRKENPEKIMADILKGVKKDNYKVVYDRGEAIKEAINMASKGDSILILGKGHENYQVIGSERVHFDDAEVVEEYVKNNGI